MNGILCNMLKSPSEIFQQEGILFFPKLFEGEELAHLREACEFVLSAHLEEHPGAGNNTNMRHLNDSRYHRDGRRHFNTIMEATADPRCLGPVEQIFRGQSLFRSTSLFFNPQSESHDGNWHRDHQFILPDEEAVKAYFSAKNSGMPMPLEGIQLQIALVDGDDIEYVPFSPSRYDSPEEFYFRCADDRLHCREEGMPNAVRVHQRAGDAAIFNPAGLHRGRYHADKPRRTLMLTYTPRTVIARDFFSHQPWMLEDDYLSGLSPRCRAYFQDFIDVYHDFWSEKLPN